MNGQDIIDHFYWLVDDDTLDSTRAVVLLNQAYDRLMMKRAWVFLYKTDTAQTASSSTTSYDAPTDQLFPIAVRFYHANHGYSDDFKPIPYKKRRQYHNVSGYYYYDFRQAKIVFTAAPTSYSGWTIEQDYAYQPAQLATNTSPVFNRAFHPLIAFEMARFYWFNDQDEKDRTWDKELGGEYKEMFFDMLQWNNRLDSADSPDLDADDPYNLSD